MDAIWQGECASPLGRLVLESDGVALTRIWFPGDRRRPGARLARREDLEIFVALRADLAAYFAGQDVAFDLPLAAGGTAFQQQVWTELRRIPWGATTTYAELAQRIGRPRAFRAVGAANGQNPLPIIVPCHRVIGSNGRLTGFAGGLAAKRWLLELEKAPLTTVS